MSVRFSLGSLVLLLSVSFAPGCMAEIGEGGDLEEAYSDLGGVTCKAHVRRLAGKDRYDTAGRIAQRLYPDGADRVIITTGATGNPDALVAGPLGATRGGPVLLTGRDELPAATRDAIAQLGAGRATVLGGTAAVSGRVVSQLRAAGLEVDRIAGSTRFDTAARVAQAMGKPASNLAFIASGTALTDAVAGAAAGAALGSPLLYVERDRVPEETRAALADLGITRVAILGGTSAVSESVARTLDQRYAVDRIAGDDRYATAARVATYTMKKTGARRSHVFVASGQNTIDALAASADGSPVLLSAQGGTSSNLRGFLRRYGKCATVLGGEAVLGLGVERGTYDALRGPNGGGAGYPRMAPASGDGVRVVSTKSQLLNALAGAQSGDVVYVADNASIDLTGQKGIAIPGGVTLASGRGRNGSNGALLYVRSADGDPIFSSAGERVRITGLRFRGPDTEIGPSRDWAPRYLGIDFRHDRGMVDNCELWGWALAAIRYRDARHGRVLHNRIHHNRRTELGYGVVLYNQSDAIVEANHFYDNRHAVAGSGERGQSYTARYNLVTGDANGHIFDMHGESENPRPGNESSQYAGTTILVHHNTVLLRHKPAVLIRGIPDSRGLVENNCFAHGRSFTTVPEDSAVVQTRYYGGIVVRNNRLLHTGGRCY